jgi:hypothetical protein
VEGQRRYRCSICKGEIDVSNYHWYFMGLKHGRAQAPP